MECTIHGKAILKSANLDKSWEVVVEGSKFQKGWEEFAQAHDLHVGDFVVFGYEGGMVFNVIGLDSTQCQREYPMVLEQDGRRGGGRRRTKCKKDSECAALTLGEERSRSKRVKRSGVRMDDKIPDSSRVNDTPPVLPLGRSGEVVTCFIGKIDRSTITHKSLNIPANFAKGNGLSSRRFEATLKDENGSSWKVRVTHKRYNGQVYFAGGWPKFAKVNRLELGDICTFKLVENSKNVIFEVNISRSDGVDADSSSSDTELNWTVEDEERAPSFGVRIVPRHFCRSHMYIPMKFARPNGLMERVCMIYLVDENGKPWTLKMRYRKDNGHVFIGLGWAKFSKANDLKIGDYCKLKLVSKGEKVVFKVTISRSTS